jgi:NADPH-dependent ferric siderophore reductase
MESLILHKIKNRIHQVVDQQLLKHGRVLDVRSWSASPMIEIDLHLPATDMRQWNEVPYIKLGVGGLNFRKYTPFGWDAETCTCSLLVDASHEGPGSAWAAGLRAGDTVEYLKTDSTRQWPHASNRIVGLGDNSSLGHLLALRQLTSPVGRFEGAVVTDGEQTAALLGRYFLQPVVSFLHEADLMNWITDQRYSNKNTSFYLTGNDELVIRLRQLLRGFGYTDVQAKGFWR